MSIIINGELVEDSVIRQEAGMLRPRFQEMMADEMDPVAMEMQLREWSRENVIERVLLRQEAWKDPEPIPAEQIEQALEAIHTRPGGQAACSLSGEDGDVRKEVETRLRLDRLIGKVTAKTARPKYKEVGEYYRKNKEQFQMPEMVHAAHIVKNVDEKTDENAALEAIRKVQEELNTGGVFEELADRYSDCAGNGGDLGYFPRGQMVEEFENVVFSMKVGEVSDIFRSVFGFHIVKLYERKPAGYRDLSEVKEQIEEALHRQRQEQTLENYLDQLKAKATIENVRGKQGAP